MNAVAVCNSVRTPCGASNNGAKQLQPQQARAQLEFALWLPGNVASSATHERFDSFAHGKPGVAKHMALCALNNDASTIWNFM